MKRTCWREQRTACLQEILNGPSPFERAAELASAYSQMKLLQRVEDSNFRQVWRITDLFIKLKGGAPERKKMKMPPQDSDAAPAPAMEAPEIAPQPSLMNSQHSSSHPPAASDPAPEPPPPPPAPQPAETSENEGASWKSPIKSIAGIADVMFWHALYEVTRPRNVPPSGPSDPGARSAVARFN